jgi:AbrB family looped-hinge helix DNA binding protein
MSKVTSKLQLTIPKAIATRYGIVAGDEVEWAAAGDSIRIELVQKSAVRKRSIEDRLDSFDQATERQQLRENNAPIAPDSTGAERGWTREELYDRGGAG